jgi:hypothetical protein
LGASQAANKERRHCRRRNTDFHCAMSRHASNCHFYFSIETLIAADVVQRAVTVYCISTIHVLVTEVKDLANERHYDGRQLRAFAVFL